MVEVEGLPRYSGVIEQMTRDVEENVRFRVVDRVHETAGAAGPADEIRTQLYPIGCCEFEQLRAGRLPEIEVTE